MKEKSVLFNLNKGYKSPLEGNAFGGKLKENMDKGMSKEAAAKQAAADLSDMPIDNRAGSSTPAANMNKGYGQQVKTPLGIITDKPGRFGRTGAEKAALKKKNDLNVMPIVNRATTIVKTDPNLWRQGAPREADGITIKNANSTKTLPGSSNNTQIRSIGTSGEQNTGDGYEGFGVGGSTKKPVVKVKTKPVVKKVNEITSSTVKTNTNRSNDFARTMAAVKSFRSSTNKPASTVKKPSTEKVPEKIMSRKEIRAAKQKDKASGMSRKEVRLNKTKRKAAAAKAKTNKIAKSIDASKPKSSKTGAKQIAAKSQRNKAKRLENRAIKIEGRIQKKKINKATKEKIKSNK